MEKVFNRMADKPITCSTEFIAVAALWGVGFAHSPAAAPADTGADMGGADFDFDFGF